MNLPDEDEDKIPDEKGGDELDAFFNESLATLAIERGGTDPGPLPQEPVADEPEPAAAASGDEPLADDPAPAIQPAPHGASRQETKPPAAADKPAKTAEEELEELRQYKRSNEGRVSALARENRELRLGTQRPPQAQTPQTIPAQAGNGQAPQPAAVEEFLASKEWVDARELMPEGFVPAEKLFRRQASEIEELRSMVQRLAAKDQISDEDRQEERVLRDHPDYHALLQEHRPDLVAWVNSQPRMMREALMRNAERIVDGEEVSDIIGRYKAARGMLPAAREPAPANPNPTTTDPLAQRRRAQARAAAAAPSRTPGKAVSGEPSPDDGEALYDHMLARVLSQRQ